VGDEDPGSSLQPVGDGVAVHAQPSGGARRARGRRGAPSRGRLRRRAPAAWAERVAARIIVRPPQDDGDVLDRQRVLERAGGHPGIQRLTGQELADQVRAPDVRAALEVAEVAERRERTRDGRGADQPCACRCLRRDDQADAESEPDDEDDRSGADGQQVGARRSAGDRAAGAMGGCLDSLGQSTAKGSWSSIAAR
jgi:hypothetical protein